MVVGNALAGRVQFFKAVLTGSPSFQYTRRFPISHPPLLQIYFPVKGQPQNNAQESGLIPFAEEQTFCFPITLFSFRMTPETEKSSLAYCPLLSFVQAFE